MSKLDSIAKSTLLVFCVLLVGCVEDLPDRLIREELESLLGPMLIRTDPPENSTIEPITTIVFEFSKPISEVTVNGEPAQISANRKGATFHGDLGNGNLKVEWKWSDGTAEKTLIFSRPPPLLKPQIAFVSERDGNFEIYVMDADGTKTTRLTNEAESDLQPDWSPDGNKIAFTSSRDGNLEIYVMNADGTDQTRLTSNPEIDSQPAWSPDGGQIAFFSRRDGNGEIYLMSPGGEIIFNFSNNPAEDNAPAWSEDQEGIRIVFASTRQSGNFNIYIIKIDGTDLKRLTTNSASDGEPTSSPILE